MTHQGDSTRVSSNLGIGALPKSRSIPSEPPRSMELPASREYPPLGQFNLRFPSALTHADGDSSVYSSEQDSVVNGSSTYSSLVINSSVDNSPTRSS